MIAERKRDAISSMCSDLASAFGRKRGAGSEPLGANHQSPPRRPNGQHGNMNLFVLPTASRRKCPQLSVSGMNSSKLS